MSTPSLARIAATWWPTVLGLMDSKDGDGYKFKGTATGIDKSNPMAGMVSKPFEIDVTCP